jgi:hypothetical protein
LVKREISKKKKTGKNGNGEKRILVKTEILPLSQLRLNPFNEGQ